MICCDQCEEWQHLPCHRHADALLGKPPQPYTDEEFQWICARCRGVQQRRPRPPLPPPGTIPVLTYPPQPYEPPTAPGKRRASSAHAQQSAKKPKPVKVRLALSESAPSPSSADAALPPPPLFPPAAAGQRRLDPVRPRRAPAVPPLGLLAPARRRDLHGGPERLARPRSRPDACAGRSSCTGTDARRGTGAAAAELGGD